MNLHQQYLTENDCFKSAKKMIPKGIAVHSTGSNNKYIKRYVDKDDGLLGINSYQNGWNHSGIKKMVHAFIGVLNDGETVATYNIMPYNYKSWHCGSGKNGSGNDNYISFEICEDNLQDEKYFNKIYKEAVEFCAYLCDLYDLEPLKDGVILCHWELYERGLGSGHVDVTHWFPKFNKNMDIFRNDVFKELNKIQQEKEDEDMTQDKFNEMFDARIAELANKNPPEWMNSYLNWMLENGLMSGDGNGNLMGEKFITRGEISAIFKSYYDKIDK